MTDQKREDMLRKVRGLIAKADGTDNPHEADTFRAAAERLMLKYTIAEADLHREAGTKDTREIEFRTYDFTWYWNHSQKSNLWLIFLDVARHCRVQPIYWHVAGYDTQSIQVAGLGADLDYFDLLFTSIMLELVKGLEPKPDPGKPLIENLVRLKEAGQQWLRIAEQLRDIGHLTDEQFNPNPIMIVDQWGTYREEYRTETAARVKKQVHHLNFSGKYTAYCKEHDRPRLRTTPAVYQRSFAEGFTARIWERLSEMRKMARTDMTAKETSGMDLVLADITALVKYRAEEKYPRPERKGGRVSRGRADTRKRDYSAMQDGRTAADRVDLGNRKKVGGDTGSLPRG